MHSILFHARECEFDSGIYCMISCLVMKMDSENFLAFNRVKPFDPCTSVTL